MKSILKKLRSRRGETLTEVLCAILVTGLAVGLLVLIFSTAARMNDKAVENDERLYSAVTEAEAGAAGDAGTLKVAVTPEGGDSVNVTFNDVTYYGLSGSKVSAYRWEAD